MTAVSARTYSRAVGIFLLLSMVGGYYGEMYVPSLMMGGDATTTAAQLRQNDGLFRLGFAGYLIEAVSDIIIAWLFYVLLKPVDRDLALLSALFGLVSMCLFAVAKMFYFAAPIFVRGSKYLTAFPPDQLDAFASLFILLYGGLSGLTFLFYGIGWLIRGYLTFRSGYLPRMLGGLMCLAGVGFAAKTITYVLAPAYSSDVLLAPMFFNAIAVTLWMLLKGVDPDKWADRHLQQNLVYAG